MLIIYTGNGKGKTTAALGQAVRALGQGKRVLMVQFIKSKKFKSGEDAMVRRLGRNFTLLKTGRGFVGILGDKKPFSVHRKAAQKALALARRAIGSHQYDLIILDEINIAVNLKLLKANEVLEVLKNLSPKTILIFTGRAASKSFIKRADLVTEMREIKHPFNKGTAAAAGIEF